MPTSATSALSSSTLSVSKVDCGGKSNAETASIVENGGGGGDDDDDDDDDERCRCQRSASSRIVAKARALSALEVSVGCDVVAFIASDDEIRLPL